MSYQGPPGYGNGYPPVYGQHGNYNDRPPQGAYLPHPEQQTAPSPGAYTQGRISMQQLQAMQAQNEAAYYQQSQYGQAPYVHNQQPVYYQPPPPPPQQPQSYAQYIDPRQPQYAPVQSYPSQYDRSYDELSLPTPMPQVQAPRQQPRQQPRPQDNARMAHNPMPPVVKKPKPPPLQPIDPYSLLPALAEEYFAAAHDVGLATAQRMDANAVISYQKMIATGLGCLEVALNSGRLEPRLEAKIRLRYASVLLEDTDNVMEAETALSKGITLCEQNRYFDLKYNMQVLLAKLMFTKSPKAALKALDGYIKDVEAYQHHSWIYVFRFLKATLALQSGRSSDANSALQTLRSISSIANDRGDHAIVTIASLVDALASLHMPSSGSIESIERALATVNMYQLDPECAIPPLQALGHIVDTTASLTNSSSDKTMPKLKAMQDMINNAFADSEEWNRSTDAMKLPINRGRGDAHISSQDTSGVLKLGHDGRDMLLVTLMGKSDVFILCHLLTGIIRLHVSAVDGSALKYLRQGLQRSLDMKTIKYSGSLPGALEKIRWRGMITCYFYIYMVFCSISTTDWTTAKANLDAFEVAISDMGASVGPVIVQLYIYLSAMYFQGTGDLERALELYRSEEFTLPKLDDIARSPEEHVRRELSVLAAMNSLWIMQCDPQVDLEQNARLLAMLEPWGANNANKEVEAVYNLLRASVETRPATTQTQSKAYIRAAMEVARNMKNVHLICVVLNLMCEKYFGGIVGDQAEKSAVAASTQAKKSGNLLWMSTAEGLLARSFEIQGKTREAQTSMAEAVRLANLAVQSPL
ncbi:hypothetical protein VE01_02297 [Pseudogymnoascus verrucosus]|uniref:MAU2 chromatid cohesion factor n=1 Tax=Pseudogymnoascus verrucosus TaxID=342668 RepID=A0A1B8GTF5_9PEZI|nr:uncharacterized protein VE01_02297 [Pseudogymnoascus verrucosus]OBT99118.1 hypothetical protein VE01_02297 [Pseudogymnoascus verrucosus]